MLEDFTSATFAPLAGDEFAVAQAAITVRLETVTPGGEQRDPALRTPFSLLFRGPPAPILPQRIYALEHAVLGTFEIFLVPLEPDAEGARYEAVFG